MAAVKMFSMRIVGIASLISCSLISLFCLNALCIFQPRTLGSLLPLDTPIDHNQENNDDSRIEAFMDNSATEYSPPLPDSSYSHLEDNPVQTSRSKEASPEMLVRDALHLHERRQATSSNPLGALGSLFRSGTSSAANSIESGFSGLLSGGLSSLGNGLLSDLDGPALFLGIGLGTGTATGLNLSTTEEANATATSVASANGMTPTGTNGVALNLGNGLASAAAPLIASYLSHSNISIPPTAAQAIFPLAQGIGNGTLTGLDITQYQFAPSNGTSIGDTVGNFGLGLSESLARNVNGAKIMNSSLLSGLTGPSSNLPATLQAAGVGIGQGAAQGFGVMKRTVSFDMSTTNSSFDFPEAAGAFSSGLTSSFLESADLSSIGTKFAQSSLTKNISLPTIVGGFARGLVDGVAGAASAAGGVTKLLNSNSTFSALMQPPTDIVGAGLGNTMSDASIAFGRGLGYEGTLVGGALLSKGMLLSPNSTSSNLSKRDTNNADTDPVINSTFLSFLAQTGVDRLQCDGIGGFGSILIGLSESKTISIGSLTSFKLDNSTAALLPSGTSSIHLDGNTFDFDLQNLPSAKVNGLSIIGFALILVLHILLAVSAFLFALPLFIILNSTQTISEFIGASRNVSKSQRWQKSIIFFVFLPMAFVGIVFGFIGMGDSRQLRTAHGVLGFITLLITMAYGTIYFYRLRSPEHFSITLLKWPPKMSLPLLREILLGILIQFAISSFITGFSDLRSLSLCFAQALLPLPVTVFISTTVMTMLTVALAAIGLRLWVEFRLLSNDVSERTALKVESDNSPDEEMIEVH